ncbi:hypothetical protein [Bradyrhizobium sp. CCGB01]|uniref:hypothetical protein n=1 Tax=Bradyrhizobium sp. CCGB01 TaxID=2949634 RepID=UPI0020B3E91A|nr:hypothetical protein [Bradyrhizobium sp. CCGB01]MCP3408379.1 hypothetical protein [Bradyrhizobium sp. CCGB01]
MKVIEPPTLDFGPEISTSSMAATASSVIVFMASPWSMSAQQIDGGANQDTAEAEDHRRDLDDVFQTEESDDSAPCGRQEDFHERAEEGLEHMD